MIPLPPPPPPLYLSQTAAKSDRSNLKTTPGSFCYQQDKTLLRTQIFFPLAQRKKKKKSMETRKLELKTIK